MAWFVYASLHHIEIEKHEGKNEYGLAFWVVLNSAVIFDYFQPKNKPFESLK